MTGEPNEGSAAPTAISPVQRLLDRSEIVEVINRIANAVDAREWTSVRSSFVDEVEVDHGSLDGGELSSVEADALVEDWRAALIGFDATQHVVTNHSVCVAGAEATCSAYIHAKHYLPNYLGSDSWTFGGRYDYSLVRTRQGWKVHATQLTVLWAEGNRQLFGLARRRFEEGLTDGDFSL